MFSHADSFTYSCCKHACNASDLVERECLCMLVCLVHLIPEAGHMFFSSFVLGLICDVAVAAMLWLCVSKSFWKVTRGWPT